MKKRVSLNDKPITKNRHALYVGREIRHSGMPKMFWNKENVNVWNYQIIEMIVKNGKRAYNYSKLLNSY